MDIVSLLFIPFNLYRIEDIDAFGHRGCSYEGVHLFNSTWADPQQNVVTICGNITDDARVFISRFNFYTITYKESRGIKRPFRAVISFTYGKIVINFIPREI